MMPENQICYLSVLSFFSFFKLLLICHARASDVELCTHFAPTLLYHLFVTFLLSVQHNDIVEVTFALL